MSLTYRDGVSVLQLVFYVVALFLAVWLAFRHGFRRSAGWIYLVLLSLIRIIGSSAQLRTISDQSIGVETTAAVCSSVGLSPLILLCLGLLSRVNDSVNHKSKRAIPPIIFRLLSLVIVIGLILVVVGISNSISSTSQTSVIPSKVDAKTRAGMILFCFAWVGLCFLLAVLVMLISHVERGEKRLVLAVTISAPLILVRLCYSLLADFTHQRRFNPLTGSVTINLFMAVFMEFAVTITCLTAGLTLGANPWSALAEPDGNPGPDVARHSQQPRAMEINSRVSRTTKQKDKRRGKMNRGPIHTLVGYAMDHYNRPSDVEAQHA